MRLLLFLLPVVAGFVPRLVLIGKGPPTDYYADYYAKFFRIPLIRPNTYIAPQQYVVVADKAEDLGYLWEEEHLVVVDMDRFLCSKNQPSGNRFISWVLQHHT
jgi:hypothetical protein